MKSFFRSVSVWLFILSCGEESEDPIRLQPEGATGTLAAMKVPTQAAPAAPQMLVPAGTPTVKSVGYYSDYKLTKPVKGGVPAGKTLFIKVEFSEGMKLVVADDKTARPILYRRIAGKLTRFRMVNFDAKGEDFVSGDAKPAKNQKTYLCKYTVKPEDKGVFVFAVGKFSVDRQGNKLPAFYTHTERLQIRKSLSPKTESADEEQNLADTEPPAVVSIEYYLNGNATLKVNPVTESVGAGTDIFTKITFSEPVTPVITYTTGGDETRYARAGRFGVHWRDTCKPLDATGTVFLCLSVAWEDAFSVTVSTDTADLAGNTLAESFTMPTLEVRPVEMADPVVPDTTVPTVQQTVPEQEVFGTDLVGHYIPPNIPNEIQSLFSILSIHPDIQIVVHGGRGESGRSGGLYVHPVAHIYKANESIRSNTLRIIAAELFHSHQYNTAGNPENWEKTPEGMAYIEAERKDFAEVGKTLSYDKTGPSYESASSFFAEYWVLHHVAGSQAYEHIKVNMPNRYKWAEQWFK